MTQPRLATALAVAERQHQLLRQSDLDRCGLNRHAVSRLVKAGVLERVRSPGILRVRGSSASWRQRLLAAVWAGGPGAVASHRAAGALWGLDGITKEMLEISTRSTSGRNLRGVVIHYGRILGAGTFTTVDGIPVTNATLTLVDLASVIDADNLEAAFDSALRQGLTAIAPSQQVLTRLEAEGRRGLVPFRRLLEQREEISGVTESLLEVRLIQVIRKGGLPEPTRQLKLYDEDGFIGRFDCSYPEAMTVIEADSEKHHLDLKRFHEDRRRRTRAEAIGWHVPTFTYRQVTRQPSYVVRSVTNILDRSGWSWRPENEASSQDRIA